MGVFYDFTKEPSELVAYLKAKDLKTTFNYEEMMHEAHHKAFTVAKVTKLDLLSDIHTSLQEALKEGKPFKEWREQIKPTLEKKGWWGEVEAINPKTGEVKNIFVGSRRLKTIYDTNMRTAYAKGRYDSQMQSDAEYLRYSAILDAQNRPSHGAKNGIILPKDDPWWNMNYPPNGWRCRCKTRIVTATQMKSQGLKVSERPQNIADKDWAYHVGKTDNIEKSYKEKVTALNCKSQNAKGISADCGLQEEARKEVLVNASDFEKWFKYANKPSFLVANLHPKYKKILEVDSFEVPITKKVLEKQKQNHPEIEWYEYLFLNTMINRSELVIKKGADILVHIKNILGYEYFCVIQANTKRQKAFIASFRRTKKEDIEREIKKGDVIFDKR